jgi:hypothetical protein
MTDLDDGRKEKHDPYGYACCAAEEQLGLGDRADGEIKLVVSEAGHRDRTLNRRNDKLLRLVTL